MPDGIIRDPKQNPEKEADFGVLYAINQQEYLLYFKDDLVLDKDKRYFTAGTTVNFEGDIQPLTIKKFKWQFDNLKIDIKRWVRIKDQPDPSTGHVVKQINNKIKKNISFPTDKEYLHDYTNNVKK